MRGMYAIAFSATALILLFCVWKLEGSKTTLAKAMQKLLLVADFEVLLHIGLMHSTDMTFSLVFFGLFYAAMDWLLFFLFRFNMTFVGNRMEDYVKMPLMYAVLICDSVLVFLGGIFGYSYVCVEQTMSDGSLYIGAQHLPFFNVHLGVSYLLLLLAFIPLIYKAVKAQAFYRKKYVIVIALLLLVAVADAIYMLTESNIDISVLGYALSAVLIYYYALIYEPQQLTNRTYQLMVHDMAEGVILLDADGKVVRANKSAYEIFGHEERAVGTTVAPDFWTDAEKMKEFEGKTWEWTKEKEDGTHYLEATFQCLMDKKKRFIGGFFVVRDCTQEKEQLKKEHYRAAHDLLTGIYNREHFFDKVAQTLQENPDEEYLLICSDIKDFKFLNDIFGTEAGDKVLKRIAELIEAGAKPGEVYGRIENDHFGFLMKKRLFNEGMFREGPRETICVDHESSYMVNIHVGIYEIKDRTIPVSIMCDRAFMAIRTIKDNYHQKVAYYTEEMREGVIKEQELCGELDTALREGQIQIYLQPQITEKGSVPGAEALVRWLHPTKGMIMPGVFIETFEKNGMIVKLDQYIWELACKQLKKWKDAGMEDKYISVNISPKDFYLTDIYKTFTELIAKYEIQPKNLKLEITETAIIMDLERQLELIEKLRKAGFVVEMDDFGSGYSSLNMLKDIHVDVLKIDMAFLRHSANEERSRKILKTMIDLSHSLDMFSITEGVETEEQRQFLADVGCRMYQGYYFAKPMPVSEFEQKYMQTC